MTATVRSVSDMRAERSARTFAFGHVLPSAIAPWGLSCCTAAISHEGWKSIRHRIWVQGLQDEGQMKLTPGHPGADVSGCSQDAVQAGSLAGQE